MSIIDDPDYRKLIQASLVPEDRHAAAEQLWLALPAIHRDLDDGKNGSPGDLRRFLQGFALLLDQLRSSLYRRLDDASPLTCQTWLLPYFADLLDVRLVSPDPVGQRQEIAKAIAWRKRKGTVGAAVEIAEAVGQMPIIAFEGYRSVATTPRVGLRQPSLRELGEKQWQKDPNIPSHLAEYPGTPAVTVDFRKCLRPRRVDENDPTPFSIKSRFGDEEIRWQHATSPQGIPPYLNGYQDTTPRTVDVRDGNWEQGHHHPKRLRLYTPLPEGFVATEERWRIGPRALARLMSPMAEPGDETPPENQAVDPDVTYYKRVDPETVGLEEGQTGFRYVRIEERRVGKDGTVSIRSTLVTLGDTADPIMQIPVLQQQLTIWDTADSDYYTRWHDYFDGKSHLFLIQWEQWFDPENQRWCSRLRGGTWDLALGRPVRTGEPLEGREHIRREARWPTVGERLDIERPKKGMAHEARVAQLIFADILSIKAEYCTIEKCAANYLCVDAELFSLTQSMLSGSPKLTLADTLAGYLAATELTVEAEYCTIDLYGNRGYKEFRASDCILLGDNTFAADHLKLRYCAVASLQRPQSRIWQIHVPSVHTHLPMLHGQVSRRNGIRGIDASKFGTRGFGVLEQSCHPAIRHGAEDGGELGAFHHRRYCARQEAVVDKLREFLPVAMMPVLIVDPVWQPPLPMNDNQNMETQENTP